MLKHSCRNAVKSSEASNHVLAGFSHSHSVCNEQSPVDEMAYRTFS